MRRLVLAVTVLVSALVWAPGALAASSDLFFSEYIEGSSNNKALEIFNDTGAPVDLAAQAPTTCRCSSTARRRPG